MREMRARHGAGGRIQAGENQMSITENLPKQICRKYIIHLLIEVLADVSLVC
uniref:Uncharacterized protein n=1 Tax=Anguilla anguilla TaxID=7936 RepID=A0A0E9UN81_ANGAN